MFKQVSNNEINFTYIRISSLLLYGEWLGGGTVQARQDLRIDGDGFTRCGAAGTYFHFSAS